MNIRSFASDYFSGALPEVIRAIEEANIGHQASYGKDIYTQQAIEDFHRVFGSDCKVFFVYNNMGANVLSISAFVRPYHAVICAETSHINVEECGAVQKQTGCCLMTLPTFDGKLTPELIQNHLHGFDIQHHSQPRIISISECTELGTAYTAEELKELCDFAHQHGLFVHMDGSHLSNAVAHFNCPPADLTTKVGIDVLSFGGTKNGMLFGEAIVFFNTDFCKDFKFLRKQAMQLYSKNRFIAAQFSAILKNDLWIKNAAHSNRMAQQLANEAKQIDGIEITQEVEGNQVFAIIPRHAIVPLQRKAFFYVWDENASEVRWVCSFDTTENDIIEFMNTLRNEIIR